MLVRQSARPWWLASNIHGSLLMLPAVDFVNLLLMGVASRSSLGSPGHAWHLLVAMHVHMFLAQADDRLPERHEDDHGAVDEEQPNRHKLEDLLHVVALVQE